MLLSPTCYCTTFLVSKYSSLGLGIYEECSQFSELRCTCTIAAMMSSHASKRLLKFAALTFLSNSSTCNETNFGSKINTVLSIVVFAKSLLAFAKFTIWLHRLRLDGSSKPFYCEKSYKCTSANFQSVCLYRTPGLSHSSLLALLLKRNRCTKAIQYAINTRSQIRAFNTK